MDLGLKGKSVVVTGGGSNIGRAIVLAFAEEGARLTVGDIDSAQAAKVAELALLKGAAAATVVKPTLPTSSRSRLCSSRPSTSTAR